MSQASTPKNGTKEDSAISPKIDETKIPNPDFTGKWRLKDYKGIDEYLKSEGWNWMMRKAISKLGNNQYIYHHHEFEDEEHITIKSVNKGGVYELIKCANLNDKKEIKYKDKNGNKVISVFKWNKEKTEIIEFILKELKGSDENESKPSHSHHRRSHKNMKRHKKQTSYTKCRYIDGTNQMIESITNQNGKTCISIYVKEDDISIKQLKHILHLPVNDEMNDEENKQRLQQQEIERDPLITQFPVNIIDLETECKENKDDDEKLNIENIKILQEIQEIGDKIREFEAKLAAKTQELNENIAKNDENISIRNTIKKWKDFEANWSNWDCLYFMGWLRRIKWENKQYDGYKITKNSINKYCLLNFNDNRFLGRYLMKFDRDAVRQIGINDEQDSFVIYQQILNLIKRNPLKKYESPLKYKKKETHDNDKKDEEDEEEEEEEDDIDELKELLNQIGLECYYDDFKKNEFDDMHTIIVCVKHKGIEYLEKNILSHKLKINKIHHRMQLLDAFKKYIQENQDDDDDEEEEEEEKEEENVVKNGDGDINGVKTEDLL